MCGSAAAFLRFRQMPITVAPPLFPPIKSGSSTGGFSGISPLRRRTRTEWSESWGGFSRKRTAAKKRSTMERKTSTTPVTKPMKNFAITNPTVAWGLRWRGPVAHGDDEVGRRKEKGEDHRGVAERAEITRRRR